MRAQQRCLAAPIALCWVAFALTAPLGCAGGRPKGPTFEPLAPPDGASTLVYIYRQDSIKGVSPARVKLDGDEIATMKNGEYLAIVIDPGVHEMSAALMWLGLIARSWNAVPIDAHPGETIYLKLFASMDELPGATSEADVPGRSHRKADVALLMSSVERHVAESELPTMRRTNFH